MTDKTETPRTDAVFVLDGTMKIRLERMRDLCAEFEESLYFVGRALTAALARVKALEREWVPVPVDHKERHIFLHKALDELFADYIQHHPEQSQFINMPLQRLIEWSYEQTINPTELAADGRDEG